MAKSGETLYKDQTIFYEFSSTRSSLFPLVSHLFSKISQVSFLFLSPELLLHPITLVQSTASIQVQLSPSPMDPFISKLSKPFGKIVKTKCNVGANLNKLSSNLDHVGIVFIFIG
ncbi:uncharacterized protein LOC122318098 [Carya illinoinensis]|uniref:uncharacterized protein LOC122318098 n=1 Tax=Carya illinoinensis TaxID=32201 RepID=UPI001C7194BE|nr:uncharacterized protein LOC122318098 [Carya illinoinensis]